VSEIGLSMVEDRRSFVTWLQAAPMMLIFALFFLLPLLFCDDRQRVGLQ